VFFSANLVIGTDQTSSAVHCLDNLNDSLTLRFDDMRFPVNVDAGRFSGVLS